MNGQDDDIASAMGAGLDTDRDDAPTGDFTPLPVAWYPLSVDKAEVRPTKDGSGRYVWVELSVLDGYGKGRKIFSRFNIVNANAKAQTIGQRDLAALGKAVGLPIVKSSGELIGKTVDGKVKIRPPENGYGPDNEVAAWAPIGSKYGKTEEAQAAAPKKPTAAQAWENPAAAAAASSAPAPKPATGGKRPWEK